MLDRLIISLKKRRISWPHLLVDTWALGVALYASLYLRLGFNGLADYLPAFTKLAGIFILIKLACLFHYKVYNGIWRYFSTYDALNIFKGIVLSSLACFTLSYLLSDWAKLPRSILLIDLVLSMAFLIGGRFFRRILFEKMQDGKHQVPQSQQRTIIYGTDSASRALLQSILSDPLSPYEVVGFISLDKKIWKGSFMGIPVLGDLFSLEPLLQSKFASQVIIGESLISNETIREVFDICKPFHIRPLIYHFLGHEGDSTIRGLNLEDLLPRQSHNIDLSLVNNLLKNKTVLVTGAGGSIGSELSRQILKSSPKKLILLDHSELNLYKIDSELRIPQNRSGSVCPILSDIKNKALLKKVFLDFQPDVVFHAAAYKHVHLVEDNILSAFENNVVGTLNLLELSAEHSVEKFVLVSTDKAVNPVGAMGATKRVCEILTSLFAKKYDLNFSSVRFGNVLGSSGSLIPRLRNQIETGHPVTVTHPDMTRYFMLIQEAVSLILMSSVISNPSDIHVLKMGNPVKILDIAKSLISLLGKDPDKVPIIFTDLRPGEKMHEELYLSGNELTTHHPDILTLKNGDATGNHTLENLLINIQKIQSTQFLNTSDMKSMLMELIS